MVKKDTTWDADFVASKLKETNMDEEFVSFSIHVNGEEFYSTAIEPVDKAIKDLCDTFGSTYDFEEGDEIEILKTSIMRKVVLR